MSQETVELDTALSVAAIATCFRSALEQSGSHVRFARIRTDPDGQPTTADFAGSASGRTLTGRWCVQLYIRDDGASRHVELVILGSSMLAKAWQGTKGTHSLSAGRLKAVSVIDALKVVQGRQS
ncbi:hypothetical protein JOE57_000599 [Microlunatus panaciterrae]|uniref:Uncharacterized protein n=1 Tax=Microlunatus panaciterrae TaxID=400768 RepID=A0ABS2RG08_9ACTN|nr:hypothetical protein [Microlunatus panaciterrae]MBM7797678.1 hypothetical protein [Microlunatus panaciterrae]